MVGERNILLLLFCCVPYTVLFPQRIEGNLLHFITACQNIPLRTSSPISPGKMIRQFLISSPILGDELLDFFQDEL